MNRTSVVAAALAALIVVHGCGDRAGTNAAARNGAASDAALIANAVSAAPPPVGREATVIAFDKDGQQRTLRSGSGEFTCFPDNPDRPGDHPMCFDRGGLAWLKAWMAKQPPPAGPVGVTYMLQGSWTASNEDPHPPALAPGQVGVQSGPALMILNVRGQLAGYPREPGNTGRPWVMWAGTPYEHLMVPVGAAPRR